MGRGREDFGLGGLLVWLKMRKEVGRAGRAVSQWWPVQSWALVVGVGDLPAVTMPRMMDERSSKGNWLRDESAGLSGTPSATICGFGLAFLAAS